MKIKQDRPSCSQLPYYRFLTVGALVTAYVISFTDLRFKFIVSVSLAAINHFLGSVRCTFLTKYPIPEKVLRTLCFKTTEALILRLLFKYLFQNNSKLEAIKNP